MNRSRTGSQQARSNHRHRPLPQRRKHPLRILLLALLAGAGYGMWSLFRQSSPTVDGVVPPALAAWRSCLVQEGKNDPWPELVEVPAAEYRLVKIAGGELLTPFLHSQGLSRILVRKAFLIQTREVSRMEFKRYVDAVDAMPGGEVKDQLKLQIGIHWNSEGTASPGGTSSGGRLEGGETQPVQGISQEAAQGYATWLSNRTGCKYRLPSREEWAAAVMHRFILADPPPKPGFPDHPLLHNLLLGIREWSRSQCPGGFHLLGAEDGLESPPQGEAVCMPGMVSFSGFRVVLQLPDTETEQAPKPLPKLVEPPRQKP
ncbi:MAG: SUMF1/EgtB/PvdO family nonheme iron enzyme [Magnetococcales bacterium]|nr:SUMF1/EgtB/PvdO family nonheme iron enzyme [Magnetococcales bacterium]